MKFDLLMRDGDFRLVRATSRRGSTWIIHQHECWDREDTQKSYTREFSKGNWRLCYSDTHKCCRCDTPVPAKFMGFYDMVMWNNTKNRK